MGPQLVFDAGAAVVVLLVTTTLSVYKPWGRIGRQPDEEVTLVQSEMDSQRRHLPVGLRILLAVVGAIAAAIVVIHFAGGGMGRH